MRKLLRLVIRRRRRIKYSYKVVEDLPNEIKNGIVYIQSNLGYHWQIAMRCPCGCKSTLYMNLMEEYRPSWKYEVDTHNQISLYPSVHRTIGCKSHFFLRKGKIAWCR